ncbi:MAG: hypothetical protein C5B55_13690 [Blastocatellia bacterium]|nr:MAG: hypothetical protein C5B55_13690 [Blastocatellia bacterium]
MNQVSLAAAALSIVRKITVVIAIAVAFLFGVGTTVYLSLRSPEVTVPDVVGKDRFEAEKILAASDLNFRIRSTRPSTQANPDVVLFQLPRAGEVVKAGQTVAMDISRVAKEGETPETVKPVEEPAENKNGNTNESENKPKRKPANKNENDNSNENGNTNRPANRNANANGNANRQVNTNKANSNTSDNANVTPRANVNRTDIHEPSTRPNNQNDTRRPATTPAPTAVPKPTPR